jgi:hypothetical protein
LGPDDDGDNTPNHFDLLQQAFELYRMARLSQLAADSGEHGPVDARRVEVARFILGANILLTAVEQDLAQLAVGVVIGQIPQRVRSRVERRTSQLVSALTNVPRQLVDVQLAIRDGGAAKLMDTAWSRLMTDQVLVMALPTETLRLGHDIPPRQLGLPFYPSALQQLAFDPVDLPAPLLGRDGMLLENSPRNRRVDQLLLVARTVLSFDRTRGGGRSSAASDWRRFDDRLNWAVALIRSRQDDDTLYWPPFSCSDEELITSRRLPECGGDPSDLEVQAPPDPGPYLGGRP